MRFANRFNIVLQVNTWNLIHCSLKAVDFGAGHPHPHLGVQMLTEGFNKISGGSALLTS